MRNSLITVAGLGLAMSLAACSDTTGSSESDAAADSATSSGENATAGSGEEGDACAGFFDGTVPLADRAAQDREAMTAGEITDPTTYAEINALESRIGDLATAAPEDIGSLLEEVNAPFTEAVARVNAAEPDDEGNVEFPDLTDIDVTGSEAAQDELAAACE